MIDFTDPTFLPKASLAGTALATLELEAPPAPRSVGTVEIKPGQTCHGQTRDTVTDRRGAARIPVRRPLIAVPVLPDGSPDWDQRTHGTMLDVSAKGAAVEFDRTTSLTTTALVLLVPDHKGANGCLGLEVVSNRPAKEGKVRVGGRFGGFADSLLRPESLTPVFSPQALGYVLQHPEDVLRKWAQVGILQSVLLDRVQLCPRCHSLPTFRRGCKNCGSVHLGNDRLIHHFACAYIGPEKLFESSHGLRCPKCHTRKLVVSADYERLVGPYHCRDCRWSDTELESVAQCLRCHFRFPGSQADEIELQGFHVNRLDPLALVQAP